MLCKAIKFNIPIGVAIIHINSPLKNPYCNKFILLEPNVSSNVNNKYKGMDKEAMLETINPTLINIIKGINIAKLQNKYASNNIIDVNIISPVGCSNILLSVIYINHADKCIIIKKNIV